MNDHVPWRRRAVVEGLAAVDVDMIGQKTILRFHQSLRPPGDRTVNTERVKARISGNQASRLLQRYASPS